MMKTSIIIFGYKRELKTCLDAVKVSNRNLPVGIFLDGGPGSVNMINANKRKTHLGLATSVIEGVTDAFRSYDAVIVIEDDVIVSSDFIEYMIRGLEFYRDKKDIGSITGYTPIENDTIYASGRPASWGWGTWKDRWERFNPTNDLVMEYGYSCPKELKDRFNAWGEDMYSMLNNARQGKIDSWAIYWAYFHYLMALKCIHPPHNKVENIGLNNGTHYKGKGIKGQKAKTGKVVFFHPVEFKEEIRLRFRKKQSLIRKIIEKIR